MKEVVCPIYYLGVSIGMKRLPNLAFNPLLDKIINKLAAWKGRLLSFAGKSTLFQSGLQSIPTYILLSR